MKIYQPWCSRLSRLPEVEGSRSGGERALLVLHDAGPARCSLAAREWKGDYNLVARARSHRAGHLLCTLSLQACSWATYHGQQQARGMSCRLLAFCSTRCWTGHTKGPISLLKPSAVVTLGILCCFNSAGLPTAPPSQSLAAWLPPRSGLQPRAAPPATSLPA